MKGVFFDTKNAFKEFNIFFVLSYSDIAEFYMSENPNFGKF